jgi:hypothetical protein
MTLTVIIQIDAIDAVHVFVADILAHSRQDGPSHVMVIEIHNLTICIFVNRISQGAFALQKHREDRFLIDDSHIESLIRFAVGIGLHDFIDQFLKHGQQLALLPPTNGRVVVFVLHLKIRFNTGYLCILYVK